MTLTVTLTPPQLFREILLSEGFQEIHTPKLIAGASEGGAAVFRLDYMGRQACLAQVDTATRHDVPFAYASQCSQCKCGLLMHRQPAVGAFAACERAYTPLLSHAYQSS